MVFEFAAHAEVRWPGGMRLKVEEEPKGRISVEAETRQLVVLHASHPSQ
jgi:hypothetical protein